VSVEKAIEEVNKYLKNSAHTPFFVIVDGNDEYNKILDIELSKKNTSDFCYGDAYPDYDSLYNDLIKIKEDTLLVGMGESVFLGGNPSVLREIKDLYTNYKIVVICRGIKKEIQKLTKIDPKFNKRRLCYVKSKRFFEVQKYNETLKVDVMAENFKKLLILLEKGNEETITCKTKLVLKSVKEINTSYSIIKYESNDFDISQNVVAEEQWDDYLLDSNCNGYDIGHWRTYLNFLKTPIKNNYLELVMKKAKNYEEYKTLLLTALLEIAHKDQNFWNLYKERKDLLKNISNGDIADYVSKTMINENNRIYYLTDNTAEERHAILEEITHFSKIPKELNQIYPAICDYLKKYNFSCKNNDIFNDYFENYKVMKLKNYIAPDFLKEVSLLAKSGNRAYNALETRGSIIEKFDSKHDYLYWIDALGVEYLGYIQQKSEKLKLDINIQIARAQTPTLTSLNKDFYDCWQGKKNQTKKLDELKHNKGKYHYTGNTPNYISEELEIIDEKLDWIQAELESKRATKVILTSDHGASRLAVIKENESKWEMSTKGEHSGRCCPANEIDEKPEFATEENGFWVIANYDRFKGGRKADIEVHGGASLEEVLVPIIEITLKNKSIDITNVTPEVEVDNFKRFPKITLFSSYSLENLSVCFKNRYYKAKPNEQDKHKYCVEFDDFKTSGKYIADVYEGDNPIGKIEFSIKNKIGSEKDDDFFN